jgi:hypothetical protein
MISKRKSVKQQIKEKVTVLRTAQRRLAQLQVLPSAFARLALVSISLRGPFNRSACVCNYGHRTPMMRCPAALHNPRRLQPPTPADPCLLSAVLAGRE